MAFPWDFESNFELGNNSEWTSETDSASQLDFPHANTLAGVSGIGPAAPFRGAYCCRVQCGANSTDAFLTSTGIDVGDGSTSFFRWYMYLGNDFAFTADDVVSIFKLTQAGGGTVEMVVGLNLTAATNSIKIGASDGTAAAAFGGTEVTRNVWHAVELKFKCSTSDVGTIDLYLDGALQVSATTLDNGAAVGDGVLGVMDRLATTTGTVLFDQVVQDSARIYPIVDRYPKQIELTKSGHVFVGPGTIDNVTLLSGAGTDCVLAIFDTNRGNTNDFLKVGVELKNVTGLDPVDPAGMPIRLTRGAYVSLSGTNPRAIVNICWAPAYGSAGAVRTVARRLRLNPLEVL